LVGKALFFLMNTFTKKRIIMNERVNPGAESVVEREVVVVG
jgi:hypothetical protein